MFIELQAALQPAPNQPPQPSLFDLHPIQLSAFLDAVWEAWRKLPAQAAALGVNLSPTTPQAVHPALGTVSIAAGPAITFGPPLQTALLNGAASPNPFETAVAKVITSGIVPTTTKPMFVPPFWRHLMYAYMIENTRIVEVMQKLLTDALTDETFGPLSEGTHRWLRTTEELFLRQSSAYFISPVMSAGRPDPRGIRRGAYLRMFNMDLNHGAPDGGPYPFAKAQSTNTDFVKVLQELLRELWRGYSNATNISGPNATDDSNILELINRLKTQLNARRVSAGDYANLLREEFDAVACLSWFEVSLSDFSPLVTDLKANGAGAPEEVLRKLGERAKVAPHGKSRNFFMLARDLPAILRGIELGAFDAQAQADDLYKNAGPTRDAVLRIVNHWSIATGVDLKSVPTAATAR